MTGREKFEAAFSRDGAAEFPASVCYHSLLLRDHWEQLTDQPWWVQFDPDPARAIVPYADMTEKVGDDWFRLFLSQSRPQRDSIRIEADSGKAFRVNKATGARTPLTRPPIGGDSYAAELENNPPARDVADPAQLDAVIDKLFFPAGKQTQTALDGGRLEMPRDMVRRFGGEKLPYMYIPAPFWLCYQLWGFDRMMRGICEFPDLIQHACRRLVEYCLQLLEQDVAAGAACIWLEEALMDMVSPDVYRRFNLPLIRELTEAIHGRGLRVVHYYCGNPHTRWDLLLDTGADALALEEGKKEFEINMEEVAERVGGRMALFGNVDALAVLEQGSEDDLRREIVRQCRAGRKNRSRFVLSIGSPVTPATPISRVRLYTDLAHELGRS